MSIDQTCSLCDSKVFTQINGNRGFRCKSCFTQGIEKKVRKAVSKYKMIKFGQKVGIGFSGGKDSTVLLDIMVNIEKKKSKNKLVALTVDEGISGYREESRRLVYKQIERLNIEHHEISFKELYGYTLDEIVSNNSSSLGSCALCGPLRRNALNVLARKTKVEVLATGHNMDDEAQTIIMNILRGDAFRFARISREPKKIHKLLIPRIKPLLYVSEREIVLYLFANKLSYQDINCPYAKSARRNSIRKFLIDEESNYSGTVKAVLRSHDKLTSMLNLDEVKMLEQNQKLELHECKICGEPTESSICSVCKIVKKDF